MIAGCPFRKTIGVLGWDVEGIENTQAILQIRHRLGQLLIERRRKVTKGAPQAVAPALLALVEVHSLQRFLNSLMRSKTGPFVMPRIGTELGLGQISLRLMEPVSRTIHAPSVAEAHADQTPAFPQKSSLA